MFTKSRNLVITTILVVTVVGIVSVATLNSAPTVTHVDGLLDPWSLADVSDNSRYIVKGTIVNLTTTVEEESEVFGDKAIVFTDAVITIDEELTGNYSEDQITVRTVGGKTDEYWTASSIHPEFKLREKVVLFIGYEPDSEMGDNYFVMGHRLGKYILQNGKAFGDEYKNGLDENQFLSQVRQINTQ